MYILLLQIVLLLYMCRYYFRIAFTTSIIIYLQTTSTAKEPIKRIDVCK